MVRNFEEESFENWGLVVFCIGGLLVLLPKGLITGLVLNYKKSNQ